MTFRIPSLSLILTLFAACTDRAATDAVRDSIVRVDTETGSGTGFFVTAPDKQRYVATAAHVVAGGGRISVSRQIDLGNFDHYVEAYPEADIVAFDAESDVALLQLRNVPAEKMPPLELAEPVGDEAIASYGFPASSLVGRLGLTRKDGKLSNMVQLPRIDSLTRRVLKQNAVKAVIVSSALEPGFSGGPTLNARGEVVGINVQKDDAHQAQNAAVHTSVLTALFKQLKPRSAPTAQAIETFLSNIQAQYLELPVTERLETTETTYVSLEEIPRLRALAERVAEQPKQALLLFSQAPGETLPTLTSGEVADAIAQCQKRTDAVNRLLKDTGVEQSAQCSTIAVRPLAWDLTAAALRWSERPHSLNVVKVDEVDPVARLYDAKVRTAGDDAMAWTVHLVVEGSTLKLRLFDRHTPYAIGMASHFKASDLTGKWTSASSTESYSETLDVTIDSNGNAAIKHNVHGIWSTEEGKVWTCSGTRTIDYNVQQTYNGKLKSGLVQAEADPNGAQRRGTACGESCNRCSYTPRVFATFKRVGNRLVMTRTDRNNVDPVEFERRLSFSLNSGLR